MGAESVTSIVLATAVLALASLPARAYTIEGHVVGVSDGDTIKVLDAQRKQHKIRLAGIDAPEKKQPFGQVSKGHLSDLVFGKSVVLDCGKVDKYRRDVCLVMVDGMDVDLAQVTAGMAWWSREYQREQTEAQRASYEAAEATARAGRIGLWQDANPIPPWVWRKAQRKK